MQQKDVTKLALKLAGIYILVEAILYIPVVVNTLFNTLPYGEIFPGLSLVSVFILLVALALFLIFYKRNSGQEQEQPLQSGMDVKSIAVAVSGFILFFFAIKESPLFIYDSIRIFQLAFSGGWQMALEDSRFVIQNLVLLIGNLLQLAFGIILFFKAKYFAKFV